MASVTSKVFAVTGGASGIGAATCRLLAQRGAAVICVGDIINTNFESLESSIKDINRCTKIDCSVLNVTSSAEVEQWVQRIITTYGVLDGAANVAGIAQGAGIRQTPTILEETDESWKQIMKVNLDGIFYCTRAEIRAMKNISSSRHCIVNVASIAAFSHVPDVYAYGTSKGACAYFTTCVAADSFTLGIRVNTVSPGITNTPLLPQFEPNAKTISEIEETYAKENLHLIQPDDVARTIVWLLSEDSYPVHGANINVGACIP